MKVTDPAPADDPTAGRASRKRELLLAGGCLLTGALVVPALIYGVGTLLLGDYGGGPHLGSFYGDFFRNLAGGAFRTWFLLLSPYLFVSLIRLVFRFKRGQPPPEPNDTDSEESEPAQRGSLRSRRDPFVSP